MVNLFSPMEKTGPDAENVARSASDKTIALAEERLGVKVGYRTYTAEDYQDRTYDDVTLDRARHNMDDLYLLSPDVTQTLGAEGKLAGLSGLDCVKNLRQVVLTANTVNGKLVAIPQEVAAYGLFLNMEIFRECSLSLPNTPEEFLECCRVLKEKGYDTPIVMAYWGAANAGMKVEQWGNTCLIVRELLGGATVDECMAMFDDLQAKSMEG